jgi:hypothetical protein
MKPNWWVVVQLTTHALIQICADQLREVVRRGSSILCGWQRRNARAEGRLCLIFVISPFETFLRNTVAAQIVEHKYSFFLFIICKLAFLNFE